MRTSILQLLLSLLLVLFVAGCGKRLEGRYEFVQMIPRTEIPGVDPMREKELEKERRQVEEMTRMILDFNGSKVRMGTPNMVSEFPYRIKGQRLDVMVNTPGTKTILPMTIEADGSILYNSHRYRKVN